MTEKEKLRRWLGANKVVENETTYVVEKNTGAIGNKTPDIIVVDNFYKHPDEVRDYALSLNGIILIRCRAV